jgi:arylsulfatase A-like enzyme
MSPIYRKLYFLPVLYLTAIIVGGCEEPPPPPPSPPLKNLVMIGIDTVGADTFFSTRIDDTLITRLSAAQQYHNTSAVSPWTIPSVASVLTGLYPLQHNAGQFQQQIANLDVDLPTALSESAVTLAEMLGEHAFKTGVFSAHPWFAADLGLAQGFRQLDSRKGWPKVTATFYEWMDKQIAIENRQAKTQPGQAPQPRRLFAYLHFMEAHDWHLKDESELDERLSRIEPAQKQQLLKDVSSAACVDVNLVICKRNLVYNLAVREMRIAINDVLQELEARAVLKDTLVIVYSDHGEEFWEHKQEHEKYGDPRGIYGFGHGHSLYEELLNVPLVVWHPAIPGVTRQDLVSLVDVVPSALKWLGIENQWLSLPGIALPAGADPMTSNKEPRTVYASGIAYGPEAIAVREGDLKSIMRYPDEGFEYFDLSVDPGEKHPINNDQLTMRFDVLTGDYVDLKTDSLNQKAEMDAQTLEHLKSIGYLQGVEQQPANEAEKPKPREADKMQEKEETEDTPE